MTLHFTTDLDLVEDNPFYDPMHKLWISVILQAMTDARAEPTDRQSSLPDKCCEVERLEAIYLFENEDFGRARLRELCELAGVTVRAVLKCYNNPDFDPVAVSRGISNVNPLADDVRYWNEREKDRLRSSNNNIKRKRRANLAK